jgi:hypothetical protein
MSTEPDLSYHPAMNEICRGVMDCIGTQPGDTPAKTARRTQLVADIMSSMLPLNPLETMLAGQCVMFDQLVLDATRDVMRGQTEDVKLRARPQICAMGRMLLAHLAKFQQLQAGTVARLGGRLDTAAAKVETPPTTARRPEPAQAASADDRRQTAQTPAETPTRAPVMQETRSAKSQMPGQTQTSAQTQAPPRHPSPPAPRQPDAAAANQRARTAIPVVTEQDLARILAQHGKAIHPEDDTMITTWRDPSRAEAPAPRDPQAAETSTAPTPGPVKRAEEPV